MTFSKDPKDRVQITLPKIHESVLDRMKVHAHLYAPIVLPEKYELVTYNGRILSPDQNMYEPLISAAKRAAKQESVWNMVWRRRALYFLTVFTWLYLATYPMYHGVSKTGEFETPLRQVSDILRIMQSFLPNAVRLWIDTYASEPDWFLLIALLISLLVVISSRLGERITDAMKSIWRASLQIPSTSAAVGPGTWRPAFRDLLWYIFVVVGVYGILHPWLPRIDHVKVAQAFQQMDSWIAHYSDTPVRWILLPLVFVFLLPQRWIFGLRTSPWYRRGLRWIKLSGASGRRWMGLHRRSRTAQNRASVLSAT